MFFYEGYSCPICQKPFTETDDIVTCPDCGAPHHRACWKQHGRCYYADAHNTPEQWTREKAADVATPQTEPQQDGHICAHCGAENSAFAEFCSRCGNELEAEDWVSEQQPQIPPYGSEYREYSPFAASAAQDTFVADDTDLDGVKARDLRVFVGQNAQYYLPRFTKMCKRDTAVSWNWAAFLLTPYWLWYRKQFLYGTLVLLFEILQTCCTAFFMYGYLGAASTDGYADLMALMQQHMTDPVFIRWEMVILLCSVVQILIRIFFGIVGNYLYFRIGKKRILKGMANGVPASAMMHSGGVSVLLGAIAYAVLYFVSTFANILFM